MRRLTIERLDGALEALTEEAGLKYRPMLRHEDRTVIGVELLQPGERSGSWEQLTCIPASAGLYAMTSYIIGYGEGLARGRRDTNGND